MFDLDQTFHPAFCVFKQCLIVQPPHSAQCWIKMFDTSNFHSLGFGAINAALPGIQWGRVGLALQYFPVDKKTQTGKKINLKPLAAHTTRQ